MPNSFNLPDHKIIVAGTPEVRKRISGSGDIEVDGEKLTEPIIVDRAVSVSGTGFLVTDEVGAQLSDGAKAAVAEAVKDEPKAPRKPRPSEIKAKKAKR